MTISEATAQAKAALAAGDLPAVRRALEARRKAIASGETPSTEAFAAGEELLRLLRELQRQAAYDSARIGQVRRYLEFRK